ncbi:MAG: TSUP family transporter [Treponema sp.]|nr:TSUP family transporter [Treponema sp.]
MSPEPAAFFIVCPLVFLAGFVDSVAGGGGLISLPAYMLAGVPIHFALGTNKLSSTMGAVTASFRYYRGGFVDLVLCVPSVAAALTGAALGTSLTLLVDERYLRRLLLIVLPLTAFYVLRRKELAPRAPPLSRSRTIVLAALISFVIGGYDGFFGPGAGAFLILLYTALARIDPRRASGNAKVVNLASNLGALVLFLYHGRALVPLGLAAGAFSVAGSYLGSGLVMRKGAGVLRVFILAVLALLLVKTGYDLFAGSM